MKTNGELQYLAQKYGWEKKPLTRAMINRMTADEADWQSRFNAEEFARAGNEDTVKAENKKNLDLARAKRIFDGTATLEEDKEAGAAVAAFCKKFPQFRVDFVPNQVALGDWLKANSLPITEANVTDAFIDLARHGKLVLDPTALGIGTDDEVSGYKLMRHPELHRLLAPAPTAAQKEKLAERKMSAAEWREAHKEDFKDRSVSDFQLRAWNQAIETFKLSNPTYATTDENRTKVLKFISSNGLQINPQALQSAFNYLVSRGELELIESRVVEGQATRYTNLGGSQPGFPPKSDKYSFQKKISSMGSQEYLDRINNDPAFREAVNALG